MLMIEHPAHAGEKDLSNTKSTTWLSCYAFTVSVYMFKHWGQRQNSCVSECTSCAMCVMCTVSECMSGHYLSPIPRDLGVVLWAVVMEVGNSIQPHHIDPVGHEVQVEHGQGP